MRVDALTQQRDKARCQERESQRQKMRNLERTHQCCIITVARKDTTNFIAGMLETRTKVTTKRKCMRSHSQLHYKSRTSMMQWDVLIWPLSCLTVALSYQRLLDMRFKASWTTVLHPRWCLCEQVTQSICWLTALHMKAFVHVGLHRTWTNSNVRTRSCAKRANPRSTILGVHWGNVTHSFQGL